MKYGQCGQPLRGQLFLLSRSPSRCLDARDSNVYDSIPPVVQREQEFTPSAPAAASFLLFRRSIRSIPVVSVAPGAASSTSSINNLLRLSCSVLRVLISYRSLKLLHYYCKFKIYQRAIHFILTLVVFLFYTNIPRKIHAFDLIILLN